MHWGPTNWFLLGAGRKSVDRDAVGEQVELPGQSRILVDDDLPSDGGGDCRECGSGKRERRGQQRVRCVSSIQSFTESPREEVAG